MHSFGLLQWPCCSLQPGKQRAGIEVKKKETVREKRIIILYIFFHLILIFAPKDYTPFGFLFYYHYYTIQVFLFV